MAMMRYKVDKYASLEMNYAEYLATGNIVSQIPLGEEFTAEAPCENGMWVCADRARKTIASITGAEDMIGIVYTAEKEYNPWEIGLKNFRKVAGDYPRVGVLSKGDTFTSNCFQYDSGEFADQTAVDEALKALATTPLYLAPVIGSAVPKLTATKPATGAYATVVKFYTVPNGEPGIKYNMNRV